MKIINFKGSNFVGDCFIDEDIVSEFEKFNNIAVHHDMTVVVISSGRRDTNVKGAIVTPAKMSNHLVYQAVDVNVKNRKTGEYYNSKKMGDGTGADELFLQDLDKSTNLTWGVAFTNKDEVHFDTRINLLNPKLWHQKYDELHADGVLADGIKINA